MNTTILNGVVAFFVAFLLYLVLIPILKKDRVVQYIRKEGPESHFKKSGTPTGGGVIFLIVPLLFIPFVHNREFFILYVALFLNGLIGFIDDFLSIRKGESLGLSARGKIILQFFSAIILYFLAAPFLTSSLSFGKITVDIGKIGYFLLFLFIMIGSPNAFNLTDGLDGLSSLVSLPILFSFALIGTGAVRNISFILIGVLLAYLWFNSPKAAIFMGDTGSLAIGGLVGMISIIGKFEVLLAFLAIIPILETLSVIIQVSYFKLTNGKRVFKMAPIHHHFELSGWSEAKIDMRFFVITVISCMIGIVLLWRF